MPTSSSSLILPLLLSAQARRCPLYGLKFHISEREFQIHAIFRHYLKLKSSSVLSSTTRKIASLHSMAAGKENLAPVVVLKKRASFAIISSPIKAKRRALSELPVFTNVAGEPMITATVQKPQRRRQKTPPEEDDPQLCTPYAADILTYLRCMEAEERRRPAIDYIEKVQMKNVSALMRAILVDWLVEVAEEYKLASDTLYLAISHVDRFLSRNQVEKKKLQLLGVSSVLIASKYEEIHPPNVEDLCYITDNTYSKKEVVDMEASVLKCLNFEMGNPTTSTFLRNFMKAGIENRKMEFIAWYLAELSLIDYECIRFLPSKIAASVLFLARFTMQPNRHPWSSILQQHTGYSSFDLKDCVCLLLNLQMRQRWSSLTAIRDKYKQKKFMNVSAIVAQSHIPLIYFEDCR